METIKITRYQSPVGEMLVGSYGDKLCICDWAVEKRRSTIDRRIQRHLNAKYEEGTSDVIERAIGELEEYFAGHRKTFDIPVVFTGSEFQCTVWDELMKIPYGTTLSYGELAASMQKGDCWSWNALKRRGPSSGRFNLLYKITKSAVHVE